MKDIAVNRKAYHDYFVEESLEAGLALTGTEIKAVRGGKVDLRQSYAELRSGELWLVNANIAHYAAGNRYNHDPHRPRKLLLHRREIARLVGKAQEKGFTLVPLKLYIKSGFAKVELALARGKKLYDKREAIAQRDAEREMQRQVRAREVVGTRGSTGGASGRRAGRGALAS